MNALKIPENGVTLKGSPGADSDPVLQQAFTISLDDSVIEGMIKCVQNGGDIELALGSNPSFLYGSKTHRISAPSDEHPQDLYLTQPYNSVREGVQIPSMSLFRTPKLNKLPPKTSKPLGPPKSASSKSGNQSSASSLDSDVEALANGFAAHDASKQSSVLLAAPLSSKRSSAANKNKTLSWGNGANARSNSTSPALKPTASPSLNPAISSMERSKQQRSSLVHELAVGEKSTEHLRDNWAGKPEDFQTTLEKVADQMPNTKKWAMRKAHWKELDVWNYDYDTADREQAIKNAIRQYDKQRLSSSEPEWERLNAPEDRGKGICLSRLQANLAKGPTPAAPRIKVQKAEGGSTPKDERAVTAADKSKAGAESMTRSTSNPLPKPKKATGSEAQAKRLLGTSKSKASTPKASTPKASTPKVSPAKPKAAAASTAKGRPVLSQEFIENSDSSGDEAEAPPPSKPKTVSKPVVKPSVEKNHVVKSVEKPLPKPKVVAREPVARPAPKPATKRSFEEDDDSSSSSGTPLSKRIKPKQPLPSQSQKKRPVDSRQAPRDTNGSSFNRNQNTSPTKSSPLASSPPTNASDITEDERILTKKRKAGADDRAPPAKRQASEGNVSPEVVSQAQRFRTYYSKYEALHHEISALDSPPEEKLADLKDMRDRLAHMKEEIYRKCRI